MELDETEYDWTMDLLKEFGFDIKSLEKTEDPKKIKMNLL
jgi:hypothetical protein